MKTFENEYVLIWIEEEILYSNYKKQLVIDIEVAKQIVADRLEFTEGVPYFILIDFTHLKSISKEARDYMNSPAGGLQGLLGGAFLSNNVVGTLFVNLYLKVSSPIIPSKFFTNKADSIQWLKKIKRESLQLA